MWNFHKCAYTYPTPSAQQPPLIPDKSILVSMPVSTHSNLKPGPSPPTYSPMPMPAPNLSAQYTTLPRDDPTNGTMFVHKHKHRHRHSHHYYFHVDPSLLPQDPYQTHHSFAQAQQSYTYRDPQRDARTTPHVALPFPTFFSGAYVNQSYSSEQQYINRPQVIRPTAGASQVPATVSPIGVEIQDRSIGPGRKKALCIGVNYVGQRKPLRGCVNDAKRVRKYLMEEQGFQRENIIILADVGNASGKPTKKNILRCMRWLAKDAKKGDSLFFHFSGHGGQVKDLDGDEVDGWDEVIFPVDFNENGYITDDEMHDTLVKPLPEGCRLTALFDSCHSGTALDLPYIYSVGGHLKNSRGLLKKRARAHVVAWAGCQDEETSKDTYSLDGSAVGAMSHAFISSLKQTPRQTYRDLLKHLRAQLQTRHNQRPQLSSSRPLDSNQLFVI
ncbi:hypothetical protein AX17_005870 [Amanita inopinata Kibby_2008]|nr:hypothetical protein AX17_005870 [Amanita inopinata Kibby_2008]